ncbi:MAG: SGNH/GDSL hydrolase family protein [Ruminococcaceae bacterium]|nr:SGNH/GDSL hydrolase family protein [Oscillospiraceae bacterium]
MKKIIFSVFTLLFAAVIALTAFAAEKTVYVKDGGTGDGSSASSPVGSLSAAATELGGKGGTIVLVGDTTVSAKTTIPEQSGNLTVTAQNGAKLLIKHRLQLAKNTNTNITTFDVPFDVTANFACYMFGGCNNIVFTENCVMTQSGGGSLRFYGGLQSSEVSSIDALIITRPYSITVKNGNFNEFTGGHFRSAGDVYIGTIAAPISINISGGTFGAAGEYDALAHNKAFNAFTVSGMNFLADDATLNISGGTFNTPIYISGRIGTTHSPAQSISKKVATNKDYYAQDGDINITISGGTFNGGAICDTYVDAGYSRLMRGDYTVTVTGGTFKSGTVFDATQVKPYKGENKKASITYDEKLGITAKRFDIVNGKGITYKEPTRVAFIGDSITEGHSSGNPILSAYPAQYLALETAAGNDVIVSNLGVSASGMLPSTKYYYPEMLPAPLALGEVDADIYFFALGTNDAFSTGGANGTAKHFYDEYKAFIKACGDNADTDKVYISSALFRGRGVGPYSMRAAAVMRPLQKKVAADLAAIDAAKYHFVDLYALTYDEAVAEKLFSSDNLHPHADGYGIMAKDVYNAIHSNVFDVNGFALSDVYVSAGAAEYGAGTKTSPASSLSIALSKCAPNATIHVSGVIDWNTTVAIPEGLGTITIKGDSTGAAINFTADATFQIGSNVVFDNIKISTASGKYVAMFGNYNNVTFTESFTTSGDVQFYAGYRVVDDREQIDVYSSASYDTVESASSNKNATVNVLGGTFTALSATNRRFTSYAPFGSYGGNMVFNVGKKATVTSETNSGIVGMNYLTGTITANINGWGNAVMKDNMRLGSMLGNIAYVIGNNTGKLIVNVANGVTVNRAITGDIDENGTANISDLIVAIRAVCNDSDISSANLYTVTSLKLLDVLHLARILSK